MILARRALFILVAGGLIVVSGPAAAQVSEPEATPPDTDADNSDGTDPVDDGPDSGGERIEFDLSDVVVIGPDGSVRWNVENDNVVADEPTPTSAPLATAEPAQPEPAEAEDVDSDGQGTGAGTGNDDPGEGAGSTGAANNLPILLGVAAGAAVLFIVLAVLLRNRRRSTDGLDVLDNVMDPLAPMSGEFPPAHVQPEHAGAQDAGAYEPGNPGYASNAETNAGFGGAGDSSAPAVPMGDGLLSAAMVDDDMMVGPSESKLEQLRASMASAADRGLAESGTDLALAKKLEGAGSKMRPGEWIVLVGAAVAGALFAGVIILGWVVGGLAAVLVGLGFWIGLGRMERKRHKLFAEALPETLGLIAGSLRGGFSMLQAIGTVAEEADEPTAEEFQRIVSETRLGRDSAVALRDLAERMDSKDFEWVATAIEIHREVGGDLAKILDRVGDTIRSRNRVQGQVKALSAEGRASGILLFCLPPGMLLVIGTSNRPYINLLLNEKEGQIMLGVATVMLLLGGIWLKRLARFVY